MGPSGLSDTPGDVCMGPWDALGRVRPKGGASWEVPGASQKCNKYVFHCPWRPNVYISDVFRWSTLPILGVPRNPCEPWGASWEVLGAHGVSSGALRGSWGKRARDWSVQGGSWKPSLAIPGRVLEGKTHTYLHGILMISKTNVF